MSARALLPVALIAALASCVSRPWCDAQCRAAGENNGYPVPAHRTEPDFPRAALRGNVSGCVVVSFVIRPDGLADKFQILDSKPVGVFDVVTLRALKEWRFEVPARPGRYAQRIDYAMEDNGARPCIDAPGYDALNATEGRSE